MTFFYFILLASHMVCVLHLGANSELSELIKSKTRSLGRRVRHC